MFFVFVFIQRLINRCVSVEYRFAQHLNVPHFIPFDLVLLLNRTAIGSKLEIRYCDSSIMNYKRKALDRSSQLMLISTESNQSIVYLLINNTVFFLLETRNKQFFSRHHNSAFYALLDVRNFLVFFGNNLTCHTTLATQNTISCYFHRISFTFRHFCTEY